jgi:hypothetical protein
MIIIHILSGPVALVFDLHSLFFHGCIDIGAFFKLFKIMTTPIIRGIILGALYIFPILITPFLAIITIIIILSIYAILYLQ